MKRPRAHTVFFVLISLMAVAGVCTTFVEDRYPWLRAYLADSSARQADRGPGASVHAADGPTHVLFTFVDHFEPHDQATMDRWMAAYPALASRHRDADGRPPQHSWFWFFGQSDGEESLRFLQQLAQLSFQGLGEVELHLHHFNDTPQTWAQQMTRMLQLSQWTGAMVTAQARPQTAFGFIHGMWALDNSRRGEQCGVNNELILLRRLGCYADFTHPSWGPMHPRIVNRLYYATDNPERPKSYDRGVPMRVGGQAVGDLLIFEGPSVVRWHDWRPRYDHGDITMEEPPTPTRIHAWVDRGIHVQGRPEWVFVKIFTHGAPARDHEAVLGEWADRLHTELEQRYNDGRRYVLHYVTAREAYNIAKAAEAGKEGNPHTYRDSLIPPYANRKLTASVPYELLQWDDARVAVRFLSAPGSRVQVRMRARHVDVSSGAVAESVTADGDDMRMDLRLLDEGLVEFDLQPSAFASQQPNAEPDT